MSNLTITIDDELLRAARVKAVQQGTSVNEVCRQAIAAFALEDEAQATAQAHARAQAFMDFTRRLKLGSGPAPRLTRGALYDEMLAERSPGAQRRATGR